MLALSITNLVAVALLATTLASPAAAQNRDNYRGNGDRIGGGYGGYYDPCRPTGAGALVGAVTGGLIGSGLSRRRDGGLGTLLGAVTGALAGNAIEANGRCPY